MKFFRTAIATLLNKVANIITVLQAFDQFKQSDKLTEFLARYKSAGFSLNPVNQFKRSEAKEFKSRKTQKLQILVQDGIEEFDESFSS